jgi:hypothetical protein
VGSGTILCLASGILLCGCAASGGAPSSPAADDLPGAQQIEESFYPIDIEIGAPFCPVITAARCAPTRRPGRFLCTFRENNGPVARHATIERANAETRGHGGTDWRWVSGWKRRCGLLY